MPSKLFYLYPYADDVLVFDESLIERQYRAMVHILQTENFLDNPSSTLALLLADSAH